MEIFERMAWYGFWIPFPLYLTGSIADGCLGMTDRERGVIAGVSTFFLYLFPVVTGALADKFGFKRTLLAAYLILVPGYFFLGEVSSFGSVLGVFLIVALGAALFKPVITGTVARVTSGETKALGFGIFYMMVNVGGFLGPIITGVLRGWDWGFIFWLSSIWIGVNLLFLLPFYKEPPCEGRAVDTLSISARMKRVWVDVTQVLGNARFFLYVAVVLVLLIPAGGPRLSWASFGWVFLAWTILNLFVDFLLRMTGRRNEEIRPGEAEPFWRPMRLGNWRFGVYILILSGLWTVLNQMWFTVPLYIRDYTDTSDLQQFLAPVAGWVTSAAQGVGLDTSDWGRAVLQDGKIKADLLVNVDALYIILFQLPITWFFARRKPLLTMIFGTLLAGISMLLGMTMVTGSLVIFMIFVFSLGEMMSSPKSQEYVARIAPPDKAAMYMGYYFVCIALGNLFAGLLSGHTYQHFANPETGNGHPEYMWLIFAGIAVLTALALVLFNRFCAPQEMGESGTGH
jgi:dipeptide/tripeptide permease